MPKRGIVIRTDKGHPMTRNPARIVFAADLLRTMTYGAARTAIVKQWGINKSTAEKDIAAAKKLIALELDGMEVRAAEVRRNERIADHAEELANQAAERARASNSSAADWGAVAQLQKTAVMASREVSRLAGAYAPKQVKVTHSVAPELAHQLDAILGILSAAGRAHMDAVNEEILAAIADGRLAPPEQTEADDAEFTDVPALPPTGEEN